MNATSHEIAEAVTDPNVSITVNMQDLWTGFWTRYVSHDVAWYDDDRGEIGDVVAGQTVYLNGYAVQREADQNDQAMTPAGATSRGNPVRFFLEGNRLWELTNPGWVLTNVFWAVAPVSAVSDQGIDNNGRAMVDLITTDGRAFEYHDGGARVQLGNGVRSAAAGQGASYVLFNNGDLKEYHDSDGAWSWIHADVASISAGTDKLGVNAVDLIFSPQAAGGVGGQTWEYSDTRRQRDNSHWHYIGSDIRSISAGQQGMACYVRNNGGAVLFDDGPWSHTFLDPNVAQATAGTDVNGQYLVYLLYTDGSLREYRPGDPFPHFFHDAVLNGGAGRSVRLKRGWSASCSRTAPGGSTPPTAAGTTWPRTLPRLCNQASCAAVPGAPGCRSTCGRCYGRPGRCRCWRRRTGGVSSTNRLSSFGRRRSPAWPRRCSSSPR
jgi:hypothetical protein